MKKPMVRIHDIETDTIVDREMNDEEYQRHLQFIEAENQAKIEKEEKIAARTSALAKLAALGLTEDEIAAL